MSNSGRQSFSKCGNPIWVDDIDGMDYEPTAGLRGEAMELRLASVALGFDDEPVALRIFLGQGEAKTLRCANENTGSLNERVEDLTLIQRRRRQYASL